MNNGPVAVFLAILLIVGLGYLGYSIQVRVIKQAVREVLKEAR